MRRWWAQGLLLFLGLALAPALGLSQTPEPPKGSELPSLAPLIDSVKGAVINVDVRMGRGDDGDLERFHRFFGGFRGRIPAPQGTGSGFIIDPSGVALTNNHVVENAVTIRVKLNDGRTFEAQVLGRDPQTDIAVIKLKGVRGSLPFVKLGDSSQMRVGDWVVAIGNPFGLASSVSVGIISALQRELQGAYDDFFQTDAAINPGNSGGPLFNLRGEVIGINTAIIGGATGIGFAVPSNLARALLPQLEKGEVVRRGWLGIGIYDLTPDLAAALKLSTAGGAVVNEVSPGSPASKAGFKVDDVVVALDGATIGSAGALTRAVALKKPGSVATVGAFRAGKRVELKVTLGTRPDARRAESGAPDDDDATQPRVGLDIQDAPPGRAPGVLITTVQPGSPADEAGLEPDMLIVEAAGRPVRSRQELISAVRGAKSGETLLLRAEAGDGRRRLFALRMP